MIDVINVSTGRSFPTDLVMKQHVLSGTFATGFALAFWPRTSGSPPISRRRSAPMRRSAG